MQWTLDVDDQVWVLCRSTDCEGNRQVEMFEDETEWWDPSGAAGVRKFDERDDHHSGGFEPISDVIRRLPDLPF